MPSIHILITFVVTTALFAFIPGPAMLYAAARTMVGGRRAGLMAVLGIHIGAYAHIIAAAAGLSFLFQSVPLAYAAFRFAGALYLIWLGILLIRSGKFHEPPAEGKSSSSGRKAFLQSIAVEVLNPKTAIFFLAFLPQFVDLSAGLPAWVQFVIFGTIVNCIFTLADIVSVVLAETIMARMKRSTRIRKLVQATGGTILIGLGARLALERS